MWQRLEAVTFVHLFHVHTHTHADGVWVLTSHDVECLAIGTGILGSGGGGDPNFGRLLALQLLKQGKELKIFNPFRYSVYIVVSMATIIVTSSGES